MTVEIYWAAGRGLDNSQPSPVMAAQGPATAHQPGAVTTSRAPMNAGAGACLGLAIDRSDIRLWRKMGESMTGEHFFQRPELLRSIDAPLKC